MTLQQLIYFQEVARTNSYTNAAANLFVAQSSISYSIQELETELSVPLFARSGGKKVVLTDYGETFRPYVKLALDTLEDGKNALMNLRTAPAAQTVKILYSHFTAFAIIQKILGSSVRFINEEIFVQLVTNREGQALTANALVNDEVDLAFAHAPPHGKVAGQEVAKQELVAIVPSDHKLAEKKSISASDIGECPFIWYRDATQFSKSVEMIFEHEKRKPNVVNIASIHANWFEHISAVAFGRGITIVPASVARENNNMGIVAIPLDNPLRFRGIYLLWRKDKCLSDAVQYVKDYCLEYCGAHDIIDSLSDD